MSWLLEVVAWYRVRVRAAASLLRASKLLVLTASLALLPLKKAAAQDAVATPTAPPPPAVPPAETPPIVSNDGTVADRPSDAPPPLPPYRRGVVLEASLGSLVPLGRFGRLAPPGAWFHTQLGVEILRWLMIFAEGEMAFTDTSVGEPPQYNTVLPIFGFGGGVRFTIPIGTRVGLFLQGDFLMMKIDTPSNTLVQYGFDNAEKLSPAFGGRVGGEWYQADRHLAIGASVGTRRANGFVQSINSDNGLLLDASFNLRYTF